MANKKLIALLVACTTILAPNLNASEDDGLIEETGRTTGRAVERTGEVAGRTVEGAGEVAGGAVEGAGNVVRGFFGGFRRSRERRPAVKTYAEEAADENNDEDYYDEDNY